MTGPSSGLRTTTDPAADPAPASPLWWANSYKVSHLLLTLVDLGLWSRLAAGPVTPEELSRDQRLDAGRLDAALDILRRFALVELDNGRYSIPPDWTTLEPLLRLESHLLRTLLPADKLEGWLRGTPTSDPLDGAPSDETVDLFLNGFESFGEKVALLIWRIARLGDRRGLLDLGGAAGGHAAVFARLSSELRFTIFDREIMRRPFNRRVSELQLGERLRFVGGNLRQPETLTELVAEHDAILLSNVLHLLDPDRRNHLYQTLRAHMQPGARLIVHDLFLDSADWHTAAFMSIDWMLLGTEFSMTIEDCAHHLGEHGFELVHQRMLPGLPGGLVVADAPQGGS
ncbi:MAG: hypothetical protein GY856_13240 [bacterium]|nr:hypothetical protein [bacterium]